MRCNRKAQCDATLQYSVQQFLSQHPGLAPYALSCPYVEHNNHHMTIIAQWRPIMVTTSPYHFHCTLSPPYCKMIPSISIDKPFLPEFQGKGHIFHFALKVKIQTVFELLWKLMNKLSFKMALIHHFSLQKLFELEITSF